MLYEVQYEVQYEMVQGLILKIDISRVTRVEDANITIAGSRRICAHHYQCIYHGDGAQNIGIVKVNREEADLTIIAHAHHRSRAVPWCHREPRSALKACRAR